MKKRLDEDGKLAMTVRVDAARAGTIKARFPAS
jgi:hypothetical protein